MTCSGILLKMPLLDKNIANSTQQYDLTLTRLMKTLVNVFPSQTIFLCAIAIEFMRHLFKNHHARLGKALLWIVKTETDLWSVIKSKWNSLLQS